MKRVRALVVALALLAGCLAGVAPPVAAHPGPPSPIFDKFGVGGVAMEFGLKGVDLDDRLQNYKDAGRIAVDLDVENVPGPSNTQVRHGAVTVQENLDGRDWTWRLTKQQSTFENDVAELRRRGYRLVDIETYRGDSGVRYYNGLFVENVEGFSWNYIPGWPSPNAASFYKLERGKGRMPIDMELFWDEELGGYKYAITTVQNAEKRNWRVRLILNGLDELTAEMQANATTYRMLSIDGHMNGVTAGQANMTRYALIWIDKGPDPKPGETRVLVVPRAKEFGNYFHRYNDEGYRPVLANRYQSDTGDKFLGIYRMNSNRPLWPLRQVVETTVDDEFPDEGVAGLSVVVIQDGQVKYRRGWGYARIDPGNPVSQEWDWMDSRHVIRTASVAKGVSGVLHMVLLDQTSLEFFDYADYYIPDLPDKHQQQIWQLLQARGCIQHSPDFDPFPFGNGPYATALDAAKEFWDEDLVDGCDPLFQSGSAFHYYSTPSYTLAGAAYEGLLGDPIDKIVVDRLSDPYDLGTLRPVDPNANVRRATLYKGVQSSGNWTSEEADPDDLSWKTLGGGMEASALDLARFGAKLLDGSILTEAQLEELWKPYSVAGDDAAYAFGWDVGGLDDDHPVVSKNGNQLGAKTHLRLYPDDNVVVAVMSNQEEGPHNVVQLATDIGQIIMDDIDGS